MTSRRKLFLAVVGAILIAGVAGWVASSRIHSPAELAARTAPPDASAILVPAEERVLSSDIVTRGTARFGSPQQLFLAPSSLKPEGGIVARLPLPGTELHEGDVVLTTSGRPVFLLVGERPSFRDLGPGITGDDVRQLEEALARLGFNPGPLDGVYDGATGAAVAEWYSRAGFSAFEASAAQLEAIRALNAESSSFQIELISAQDALATVQAALESARASNARAVQAAGDAQSAVATAAAIANASNNAAAAEVAAKQAALNKLLTYGDTPATAEEIAAAKAELAVAEAAAEVTRVTGEGDVAAAHSAAGDAQSAVAKAVAVADASNNAAAVEVAARQEALINVLASGDATAAEIAAAQAELALAEAAAEVTRVTGEGDVAAARSAAGDAKSAVTKAVAIADASNNAAAAEVAARQAALNRLLAPGNTPATIAAAQADLALAEAAAEVTRVTGEGDVAAARSAEREANAAVTSTMNDIRAGEAAVRSANAALAVRTQQAELAASELGSARAQAGVQVPADEVIFVASPPIRVSELNATAGAAVSGALMTVTSAVVAVDGSLRLEEAPLAKAGMAVQIDEPDLNIKETGVISRVAESPGTNGVDGFHVYFEVLVDGSPPSLVGTSVRLTVPVESTGGAVLAVPVSAVTLSADGSSRVQRQHSGVLEFVTVDPGLSAKGYVQVTPIAGELKAGDLVVIGLDQTASQQGNLPQSTEPTQTGPAETPPAGTAGP